MQSKNVSVMFNIFQIGLDISESETEDAVELFVDRTVRRIPCLVSVLPSSTSSTDIQNLHSMYKRLSRN